MFGYSNLITHIKWQFLLPIDFLFLLILSVPEMSISNWIWAYVHVCCKKM